MTLPLTDHRLPARGGKQPQNLVVFLHGLGDRGDGGLLEICRIWQRDLPDYVFVAPDAPHPFDMAPPDFGGRQWFSLRDMSMPAMTAGVKQAAPILQAYLDALLQEYGLTGARMALAGFSQGCMMTLYAGPRRKDGPAGLLGYSGLLTGGDSLAAEKQSSPPVFLCHGQIDEVVPFNAMAASEQGLRQAGLVVETLARPHLGHGIDDAGIAAGLSFLQRIFSPLSPSFSQPT
jgi:phospholipase/carboxylesterase